MKMKKLWILGISFLLLFSAACQQTGDAATTINEVPPGKAVEIAAKWASTESLVLAGGIYKEGEYKQFTSKGKTYRYMADHISTKKKLMAQLEKSVTKKVAKQFVKDHNISKHKGKLAQIDANGGSILLWEKATAVEVKSRKNKKVFELSVPVDDTGTSDKFKVTYEYVRKSGWRISKLPDYMK